MVRKGFTSNTLPPEIMLKSGLGSVKGSRVRSSDGVYEYIHTHVPTGWGVLFSAGQEQRKTFTGGCNSCSMSFAAHMTNLLPRNVKRRDEWLKLGETGKKKISMRFIFSTEILSSSD